MGWSWGRVTRTWAVLAACLVVASNCSVSTPREGDAAIESGAPQSPGVVDGAGGPAAQTEDTSPASSQGAGTGASPQGTVDASGSSGGTNGSPQAPSPEATPTTTPVAGATAQTTTPEGGVTVGVTDTTITLSVVGSFSGPYSAIFEQNYRASALTWRDEVNASGGIHGRKIAIKKVDDRFSVEGAVAACKEITSNGTFAAFTQTLFPNGLACLEASKVPAHQNTIQAPKPESLGWKYVHGVKSSDSEGANLARFVASPSGLARAGHKIGLIYTSDAPPTAALANAFLAQARDLGLSVRVEKIATNQASFTAELQRLRQAGVDTVALACVFESVGVLRDAKAIAFNPVWTGVLFNADEVSAGGAKLFEGIKAPRSWAGADTPAFRSYRETVAKYGQTTSATTTNMASYAAFLVMQRALELAGRNLTREGFLAAYDRIQGFDPRGGIPPVSYGPDRIVGMDASFPMQCCNADNTWKSIGPSSEFRK